MCGIDYTWGALCIFAFGFFCFSFFEQCWRSCRWRNYRHLSYHRLSINCVWCPSSLVLNTIIKWPTERLDGRKCCMSIKCTQFPDSSPLTLCPSSTVAEFFSVAHVRDHCPVLVLPRYVPRTFAL
jgi:hypothetical protein